MCKPFHFQAAWTSHSQFEDFAVHTWVNNVDAIYQSIASFGQHAQQWNVWVLIFYRKKRCLARIRGFQQKQDVPHSTYL